MHVIPNHLIGIFFLQDMTKSNIKLSFNLILISVLNTVPFIASITVILVRKLCPEVKEWEIWEVFGGIEEWMDANSVTNS